MEKSEKQKEPSTCESCGENFTCGASLGNCWCMDVKLTDEIREELSTKFKDCLCPKCLDEVSKLKLPEESKVIQP